jgi:hypothetical protein
VGALIAYLAREALATRALVASVRSARDPADRERDLRRLVKKERSIGLTLALDLLRSPEAAHRRVALSVIRDLEKLGTEPLRVVALRTLDDDASVVDLTLEVLLERRDRRTALLVALGHDVSVLGDDAVRARGAPGRDPAFAVAWFREHARSFPPQVLPPLLAPLGSIERPVAPRPEEIEALSLLASGRVHLGGRSERWQEAAKAVSRLYAHRRP